MKKQSLLEYGIFSAIILVGIALDQLTKWLAVKFLMPITTQPIIKGVLHLTYVENRGAAFGMLAEHRWVFILLSSVTILVMVGALCSGHLPNMLYKVAVSMVVSGGIGNMIDRLMLGYVVDFIDFRLINFAVFNAADSFVCVGAGLLALWMILDTVKEYKAEKAKKTATVTEEVEKTEGEEDV